VSRLIILLPTKNEEKGLGEVITGVPIQEISDLGYSTKIIVVDGNSSDSTCDIAISNGAELIKQNGSTGKGNGVRQALDEIFQKEHQDDDLLVMLDADATYDPKDIPAFVEELTDYEVVWGSRLRGKIENGAMSTTNRIGNMILSLATSILFFRRTTDLCTGYWGFRLGNLKQLHLTADGFTLEADIFCSTVKSRLKTNEIPINYALREGDSSLKWYIDGPRIMWMSIKHRFSRK
tara:strand:+ start:9 stop:713 length:705 start_codon:yes stop_codon:yes gene_type:complete